MYVSQPHFLRAGRFYPKAAELGMVYIVKIAYCSDLCIYMY